MEAPLNTYAFRLLQRFLQEEAVVLRDASRPHGHSVAVKHASRFLYLDASKELLYCVMISGIVALAPARIRIIRFCLTLCAESRNLAPHNCNLLAVPELQSDTQNVDFI
jgi:hypothetical protein